MTRILTSYHYWQVDDDGYHGPQHQLHPKLLRRPTLQGRQDSANQNKYLLKLRDTKENVKINKRKPVKFLSINDSSYLFTSIKSFILGLE